MGVGTLLATTLEAHSFPAGLSHQVTCCPQAETKSLVYCARHMTAP